jgi:hypothetical protein
MPLPSALTPLLTNREFWSHYFFESHPLRSYSDPSYSPYPQLKHCNVQAMINEHYGLRLSLKKDFTLFMLYVFHNSVPSRIGWDTITGNPCCLQWEELDLLARCVALKDATLPHPGALVALLMRFAPICQGDDVNVIIPMLEEAWESLGFTSADVVERIENIDKRNASFSWTRDADRGWTIGRSEGHGYVDSLRLATNDEFPWQPMAEMLTLAGRTYAEARDPKWLTWHSGTVMNLALQVADTGDLQEAGVLADALEDCGGCPESILQALRQSRYPVRAWTAVEWITGVQAGSLIERWMGPTSYVQPIRHPLALYVPVFPLDDHFPERLTRRIVVALNAALEAGRRGVAFHQGSESSQDTATPPITPQTDHVSIVVRNDLDAGLAIIAEVLARMNVPPATRLRLDGLDSRIIDWRAIVPATSTPQ